MLTIKMKIFLIGRYSVKKMQKVFHDLGLYALLSSFQKVMTIKTPEFCASIREEIIQM